MHYFLLTIKAMFLKTRMNKQTRNVGRPSIRVNLALKRITRDKYLCGEKIEDISHRLAKCASPSSWQNVRNAAFPQECLIIGMFQGKPPAYYFQSFYSEAVYVFGGLKQTENARAELLYLKFEIWRLKNEQQSNKNTIS